MVENPDTEYAEAVEGESVVYKARAGGTFDYQATTRRSTRRRSGS